MKLSYLVDTDWVIDHFHNIPRITNELNRLFPEGIAISIISLAELYEGVYFSRDPDESESILDRFLLNVTILSIDEDICRIFARERGRLRQEKKLIGDFDLLIASTCLAYNLTLLTNNIKHFKSIKKLGIYSQDLI